MLKQRVITAIILLALFLAALFMLPAMGWAALAVLLVMQGTSEWSRLAQLSGKAANLYWWLTLVMMGGLLWLDMGSVDAQFALQSHMAIYVLSGLLWLLVVPFWMAMRWQVRNPLLMALVGWAVLIPTGQAMMDLRAYSPWLLLGIMALVWIADSAAYFTGRKFGKNKLAPNISPGKTWEGVIGALFGVTVYVVLAWSFSDYSKMYMFIPNILIASWCWVGLAVMGDLFESLVKRQAGVKDSGALLPGHGGLLDRIDALTSTLPLAALAMLLQQMP
ncbi:MAG: phosphatidate cytidylyltransferase [Nitrosomonadales bacterium]|nr:phosphatidate cytidylyltransferase [Nitrosomonadales bacterium]